MFLFCVTFIANQWENFREFKKFFLKTIIVAGFYLHILSLELISLILFFFIKIV